VVQWITKLVVWIISHLSHGSDHFSDQQGKKKEHRGGGWNGWWQMQLFNK